MMIRFSLVAAACAASAFAQTPDAATPFEPQIEVAGDAATLAARAFQTAPGLVAELIAAEPDLANPVAFDIDAHGRIYVAETFRLRRGVFDTRDHPSWVDADLACRTVADRIALLEAQLSPAELAELRVAHERVRLLHDIDGDGVRESRVFADGFAELADGIGSGVLASGDGKHVWFACIPNLWKLDDLDRDGRAESREVLHTGFGVRFNLIGHDLHGLRIGPDRRLYFSIGDRGLFVESGARGTIDLAETGAVLRCELDGSQLEVFATGLRNPQELAFDACGNLFTGDNNSDGGDRARWVYVVEGGDSGWRVGYQWLPDRGPWNRDGLWRPAHPGQPAWIVPPIANVAHGPSGVTFYPGTGLPARYEDCFFLCDFRATPSVSGVHALQVVPHGAGFELARFEPLIWNVCATDVEVGYDGGLYLSDWVEGWGQPLRGRMHRIHDPKISASALIAEVRELCATGMAGRPIERLVELLAHVDQRVRQAAQFELVDRDALAPLLEIAHSTAAARQARLHAIWGIGCIARASGAERSEGLVTLLDDGDAEIVAQVAKVLGDVRYKPARERLERALTHFGARVRFFAAQALGGAGNGESVPKLLATLRDNADRDVFLRHAVVRALARIGDQAQLRTALADPDVAVRRGVLLTFVAIESDDCVMFLDDPDEDIALEAARAAYRLPRGGFSIFTAKLAEQIHRPTVRGVEYMRRVLHANRRMGSRNAARAIADYASRTDAPAELRAEALEILAEWHDPSPRDRIVGGIRPVLAPGDFHPFSALPGMRVDRAAGDARLAEIVPDILARSDDATLLNVAARIAGERRLADAAPRLTKLVTDRSKPAPTRDLSLRALAALDSEELMPLLEAIDAEDPPRVRIAAVELLAERRPEAAVPVLASLCDNASTRERQSAMAALGTSPAESADAVVAGWLDRLTAGHARADMSLEIVRAGEARAARSELVAASLARWRKAAEADPTRGEDALALEGGDRKRGRKLFAEHPTAQCVRCHEFDHVGGAAGPKLDKIGARVTRPYLLESLVAPAARIAEGFALTVVELRDGTIHSGVCREENDEHLTLVDATGAHHHLRVAEIASRVSHEVSTMPPMRGTLTTEELRDLVEFLATAR